MHAPTSLAPEMDRGFEAHARPRWQGAFLTEMDRLVPWAALYAEIKS